jgi:predicted nucleic acid-binding protein
MEELVGAARPNPPSRRKGGARPRLKPLSQQVVVVRCRPRPRAAHRWIAATAIRLGVPLGSHDGLFNGAPVLRVITADNR